MNLRIKELAEQAGYTKDMFCIGHWNMPECKKFAQLIVEECASKVDWILTEGGKTQGDLIREHFGIPVSDIEAAESYHSDKGYSVGTPEAQEAFESKRGYKL